MGNTLRWLDLPTLRALRHHRWRVRRSIPPHQGLYFRMHSYRALASRALASLCVLGLLAGCGGGTESTGPSATPRSILRDAGNSQSATVGTALPTALSVIVNDASGAPVSGARVEWDAGPGSGTVSPGVSTTDKRGVATTTWTLGPLAGNARVSAQIPGLNAVVFTAVALAGAPSAVVALPEIANLGLSDTVRVRATVRDQYGNEIAGQGLTYVTLDPTVAAVTDNGLVTAVGVGSARIVASAGTRADTVPIVVAATSAACGTVAPRVMALGEVFVPLLGPSSISACIGAAPGVNGEYALALISTAPAYSTVTRIDVNAIGNTAPTTFALTSMIASADAALDLPDAAAQASNPVRDVEFARHEVERKELTPLVDAARDWQAARQAMPSASLVAEAKIGDLIKFNANANVGCSRADTRTGRVAAVGTRSIVVADTGNPAGGYSDGEYATIAATFDTLVYPLVTEAFGAPSNISALGKIVLFYTRNVNALTPSSANYTVGGFFFARDLYPKSARNGLAGCGASNEQELFYLLVPDPSGTINSNRRTKDQVTLLNLGTITHEMQHLVNASRRLYITPNAAATEETWLDEGLSHVAEELLFFRISGYTTRQNLTSADVNRQSTNFTNYASQNFSRFYNFLTSPETNSPYAPNDSLATRGATWNFLRYSAARQGAFGEASFLRALVNSPTTGFANLNNATGGRIADYLRDWSVSNIADDFTPATTAALAPEYTDPAWNFRSVFPGLRFSGGSTLGVYPIAARALSSNVTQRISLIGGGSSYVRFGVAGGRSALVTLSSNGALPASSLRYAIVRVR